MVKETPDMPEKDLTFWRHVAEAWAAWLPWVSTLVLSMFATLAQYAARVKQGVPWRWRELALDAVICIFVGVLTHLLCTWQEVDGVARSVLVAISAHMGTKAMASYEKLHARIFRVE